MRKPDTQPVVLGKVCVNQLADIPLWNVDVQVEPRDLHLPCTFRKIKILLPCFPAPPHTHRGKAKRKMLQSLRAAVEVTYGVSNVFAGIGYTWIAIAILVGGIIAWFLLMALLRWALLRCCTRREMAEDLVSFGVGPLDKKLFERKPTRSCGNVIYVVVQTLLFSGIIMVVWVAVASAGFNVWSSAVASLAIGMFGTYGCSTIISLVVNGYAAAIAKSVVVGEHVEFHGMGPEWSGRIIAINSLSVDIVRYDKTTKSDEVITMPISRFLDQPRKRNFGQERVLEESYGNVKKLFEVQYGSRGDKYTV